MTPTRRAYSRLRIGLLVLSAALLAAPLPAQERATAAPSLRLVPGDAAGYSVSLRNREQLEAVLGSKAWAKLVSLPVIKMGWQMVEAEWANPAGKLAQLRSWYEQPGNADLVRFFGELFEEEVFSYGGKNSAASSLLIQELATANQFAPLALMLKHGPDGASRPELRVRLLLQVLAEHPERIQIPDMVMGFRLTRTKPAQIAKWMGALEKAAAQLAPPLQERMKKIQLQGADVYTLVLSGDMVPWDQVPLAMVEEKPGEFNKLVKRLKEMKLTVAVTVRGNYLLLGLGEGTAGLAAVGAGLPNRLADRPELAPLARFADRRLSSINYISKDYLAAVARGQDGEHLTGWVQKMVQDAGLPLDKQVKIMRDVKALTAGMNRAPIAPGASLSFAFLTKRGFENYSYGGSKDHGVDGSKALTLLEHMGGQPLGFAVSRERGSPDAYEQFVRVLKLGHAYFEELALPKLPEGARQSYEEFMKEARPLFARLDRATGKLLLPALDGQGGIVFDAKLQSKQWHQAMPAADKDLPLPEFAVVLGVQDAAKLRQAFQEYRAVYNGLVDVVAKLAPANIPDVKLPEPKTKKVQAGTLYSYLLPDALGLDPRIAPTGGLSDRVAVFTLSQDHAQRLLTATPWKKPGSPLADPTRPLAGAGYFDFAGFVDLVSPWVRYALIHANQQDEVVDQVQTFLEILKVFGSHVSATYVENGTLVTHGETIMRDMEK